MRRWKLGLLGGAVIVAVAAVVAIVSAGGASGTTVAQGAAPNVLAATTPSPQAGARPQGRWLQLMKDKAFRDEYFALRRAQLAKEQAWWDKYAADPQSSAARQARQQLRQQEQADVTALLKKYGVTVPQPPAGAGLQQLRKLRNNAQFRAAATKLAQQSRADMQAWTKQYGADPRSSAATAALNELRTKYEADVKALLAKYGVKLDGVAPLGALLGMMGGRGLGGVLGRGLGGVPGGGPGRGAGGVLRGMGGGPGGFGGDMMGAGVSPATSGSSIF